MTMRVAAAWVGRWPRWRRWAARLGDQCGAASAEYALLLALVVIVLITALTDLGGAIQSRLEDITSALENAGG
ncbi:Flp family type IVb pilin [Thermaerobacter marianensis]|nr:Flp family type IVb pilin [Thermaerobacter marianensis]